MQTPIVRGTGTKRDRMLLAIVAGVSIIGDDHILADFKGRDGAANLLHVANRLVPKAPRDIGGAPV